MSCGCGKIFLKLNGSFKICTKCRKIYNKDGEESKLTKFPGVKVKMNMGGEANK